MKKFAAKAASIFYSAVFFSILGLTGYADYYEPSQRQIDQWFEQRERYSEQRNRDIFIILGILAAVVVVIVLIVKSVKRYNNSHSQFDNDDEYEDECDDEYEDECDDEQTSGKDYPINNKSGTDGAEDIVLCSKCGAKLPSDSMFCSECGLKLKVKKGMFCRKCGKSIDDESKFCRFCGAEVIANKLEEPKKIEAFENPSKTIYEESVRVYESTSSTSADLIHSAKELETLGSYKDAESIAAKCRAKAEEITAKSEEEVRDIEEDQESLLLIEDQEGVDEELEEDHEGLEFSGEINNRGRRLGIVLLIIILLITFGIPLLMITGVFGTRYY